MRRMANLCLRLIETDEDTSKLIVEMTVSHDWMNYLQLLAPLSGSWFEEIVRKNLHVSGSNTLSMMKIIFAQCFLNNTDLFESAHGSESSDI
jgi:hypothetical protein